MRFHVEGDGRLAQGRVVAWHERGRKPNNVARGWVGARDEISHLRGNAFQFVDWPALRGREKWAKRRPIRSIEIRRVKWLLTVRRSCAAREMFEGAKSRGGSLGNR